MFQLKCQQDAAGPCDPKKDALKKLLKEKVELYKTLLDGHWIQGKCYQFLDETVLEELLREGFLLPEGDVLKNGICDTDDEECEKKMNESKERERNPGHKTPDLSRQTASGPEKTK